MVLPGLVANNHRLAGGSVGTAGGSARLLTFSYLPQAPAGLVRGSEQPGMIDDGGIHGACRILVGKHAPGTVPGPFFSKDQRTRRADRQKVVVDTNLGPSVPISV